MKSTISSQDKKTVEEGNSANIEGEAEIGEPRGDVEMAPVYLSRLLPVFCHTFQATMVHTVRKASLSILRKMVHYIPAPLLHQVWIIYHIYITFVLFDVLFTLTMEFVQQ